MSHPTARNSSGARVERLSDVFEDVPGPNQSSESLSSRCSRVVTKATNESGSDIQKPDSADLSLPPWKGKKTKIKEGRKRRWLNCWTPENPRML
ncbi:hypothetical protein BSKO_02785 [Bryopsis sp. KO-2023]|nr:hypothetical protein BSKO_02785 [Bryopsis sp. KO-2023]